MSSAVTQRIAIGLGASNVAFRAGQLIERLLLQRAVESARRSGAALVTEEHIESSLDPALIHEALERMREAPDGEAAGDGPDRDAEVRQAA